MADAVIRKRLVNLNKITQNIRQDDLQRITLSGALGVVRPEMLRNWLKGIGGDGVQMPPLSKEYAEDKASGKVKVGSMTRGGEPIRNLVLTGDMQRAFIAGIKSQWVRLFFNSAVENEKAAKNHRLSKSHMMKVSQEIIKKLTNYITKKIRGL